jgi:uncharacterized protein with HEPN domain
MKKDPLIFLEHILENIEHIEKFSLRLVKNDLKKNVEKQYAIIRAVEIIGEAVKNLPTSFREKHTTIEWSKITGTRDKLIHHYFGVDLNLLWDIVQTHLPILKQQITRIIKENR